MRDPTRLLVRARARGQVILYVATALVAVGTVAVAVTRGTGAQTARDRAAAGSPTTTTVAPTTTTVAPTTTTTAPSPTTTTVPDYSGDSAAVSGALLDGDDLPGWDVVDDFDLGAEIFWGAPSCVGATLALFSGVTAEASVLVESVQRVDDHDYVYGVATAAKAYKRPGLAKKAVEEIGGEDGAECIEDLTAQMAATGEGRDSRSRSRLDLGIEGTAGWRVEGTEGGARFEVELAAGYTGRGVVVAAMVGLDEGPRSPLTMRDVVGRSLHRLDAAL